jgi:hypothetical protein
MAKRSGSDKREPQTIDGETGCPDPTPGKPARRIDLSTLRDVRLELAALYRRVDSGEIESQDGTRRAYVLQCIAKVIEAAEIEARIAALEERHAASASPRLPSYGAH